MADQNKLITLLEEKLTELSELEKSYQYHEILQWKQEVLIIFDQIMDENSRHHKEIKNLNFKSAVFGGDDSDDQQRNFESYKWCIYHAKSTIKAVVFGIKNNLL